MTKPPILPVGSYPQTDQDAGALGGAALDVLDGEPAQRPILTPV